MAVYAGTLLSWLLALYVLTRGGLRRIPVLAALAMLGLVFYLLGYALSALAPDPSPALGWLRWTWWGAAVGPALWLLLAVALVADEGQAPLAARFGRLFGPLATAALAVG